MTGHGLDARLRGLLANGGRVERLCYPQAARKRAREDAQRRGANQRPGQDDALTSAGPFDTALAQLEEALIGPERDRRQERSAARLEEANEVLEACYLGRHGAENVADAYARQNYHQAPPGRGQGVGAGSSRRIAGTRES